MKLRGLMPPERMHLYMYKHLLSLASGGQRRWYVKHTGLSIQIPYTHAHSHTTKGERPHHSATGIDHVSSLLSAPMPKSEARMIRPAVCTKHPSNHSCFRSLNPLTLFELLPSVRSKKPGGHASLRVTAARPCGPSSPELARGLGRREG